MSFSINKIPFIFYVFGFSIIGNSIYFNQITHPDLNQVTIIKSSTDKTFLFPDSSSFTQVSNNSIKLNKLGNGMTELTNLDYQPQSYRVFALRWTIVNGHNIYEPSEDLLIKPASFSLNSKEKKIINIHLKKRNKSQDQLFYRLAVKEIPPLVENRINDDNYNYNYLLSVFVPSEK